MWDTEPLDAVLMKKVNDLVGGPQSHLIIDDTALVKQGKHSVGVAHQYCGQLGKNANCQCVVTLTLARDEIPVPAAMRLYLPKSWCDDSKRRAEAKIPEDCIFQEKWRIALDEIDRLIANGVQFGDVLADAGYGAAADFRHGLTKRRLIWAVGVAHEERVYPLSVQVECANPSDLAGRARKHPKPNQSSLSAKRFIEALGETAFQTLSWREGTKGPLTAEFAAVRVRAADGEKFSKAPRLPGEEVWLVCERRRSGEVKYYFTNHSADTPLMTIAGAIKARWSCEQTHQQMKEELGLDHFECRSWIALRHHLLLTRIAFVFLQTWRVAQLNALNSSDSTETSPIDELNRAPAELSSPYIPTGAVLPLEPASSVGTHGSQQLRVQPEKKA